MPTYDYECGKCSHKFEVFQSMKDEPIAFCEKCGGAAKRLFSTGVGIIFKGSGFYVNDYKGKGCAASSSKSDSAPSEACASCTGGTCEASS